MKKAPALPPAHGAQLKSLNRVIGPLEGIKDMINDRRYCPDIVMQLRAVHGAVRTIEQNILKTHLSHCLKAPGGRGENRRAY